MTQFAVIKKVTAPDKVEVEVLRGTACGDDCESCGVCHYASKIRVEATNGVGAQLGDRVEIEARTSRILGAAVLVYVVPFIIFFIGYAIAASFSLGEGMCMLVSFAAFAVGMGVAVVVGRRQKNNPITYNITRVIGHEAA